jgi:hypothetical protein
MCTRSAGVNSNVVTTVGLRGQWHQRLLMIPRAFRIRIVFQVSTALNWQSVANVGVGFRAQFSEAAAVCVTQSRVRSANGG